ncbi:hypothetical protein [Buttiauxella noackiae]|nr:hypothetical protein [Buttiauxella noackiae]
MSDSAFQYYDIFYKALLYCSIIIFISVNFFYDIRNVPLSLLFFITITTPITLVFNIYFLPYILVFSAAFLLVRNIKVGYYNVSYVKIMIVVSLIFSCAQAIYFRSEDGRPALSFIDPNFSAFYVFMLFAISSILRLRLLNFFCFMLGMFMLSRAFLLAVIVFWILGHVNFIFNTARRLKLSHPFIMAILSLFLVFAAGSALRTFGGNDVSDYDSGISRFSTVNDGSNRLRFQLNEQFLSALSESSDLKLRGVSREFYTSTYAPLIPHNGFFEFVRINGLLLTIIFISFVFLSMINSNAKCTFPFVTSYIIYLCFLPVIPAGLSLLLVSLIYAVILNKNGAQSVSNNCS